MDRELSLIHRQTLADPKEKIFQKQLVVQTDINNLVHIIDQLESAKSAIKVKKANLTSHTSS